jgi:hypothetical protein
MRTARLLGERGVTGGGRVAAACLATRPLRVRVIIDGGMAHHCLKTSTKTSTNQYIGQIRPLKYQKAHKSAQAAKFRLGLPDRSMGACRGDPVGISPLGRFKLILANISCFWGHGTDIRHGWAWMGMGMGLLPV